MTIKYHTDKYDEAFKEIISSDNNYNGLHYFIILYKNQRALKNDYRIFIGETRYQNDHIRPQRLEGNFKLIAAFNNAVYNTLVFTKKVITVFSNCNKMVDIVS